MLAVDRIISVSSEDPAWPAENLLKGDGKNNKWKCKSVGERSISVVLQLVKSSKITSVDVGNENSAFIEILVGKSCLPDDNYKVLLVASSLMTLKEAKDVSNPNGVHFFKDSNFCNLEAKEKWDRVKVVCSQPYNKHIQFGLSFIKFHGDSEETATTSASPGDKVSTLGKFLLKEDQEDDIAVGSIFARRKELQDKEKPKTSAVAIRAATSQLKNGESDSQPITPKNTGRAQGKAVAGNKRKSPTDPSVTPKQKKTKKESLNINDSDSGPTTSYDVNPKARRTPMGTLTQPPPSKKKTYKPFRELLRGVVFTISGFQNPLRGDIRKKAMDMGARYVPDWNNSCTHLVCAFPNTPKFNQVKGHGKIVKKEWIEECYSKHMRIPWRRLALDPPDAKQPESEDEIYEGDERAVNGDVAGPSSAGGRRTNKPTQSPSLFGDLPPSKPKASPKEKKQPSPKKTSPKKKPVQKKAALQVDEVASSSNGISFNDAPANQMVKKKTVYLDLDLEDTESRAESDLADTETDCNWADENTSDSDRAGENVPPLPYLPEQFSDLSFYITDDFPASVRTDIKRYLIAHSGSIVENCTEDTEYVIADSSAIVNKLKEEYPNIIGVKSEWVWRCHDENRLLPTSKFEL